MKHTYILLLLLCIGTLASIQAQSTAPKIIGGWTFDYEQSIKLLDTKAKVHFSKMDPIRQNKIEQVFKDRNIVFTEEGLFIQELANGQKNQSSWNLLENKQLEITKPNGNKIRFEITQLDSHILLLKVIKNPKIGGSVLIPYWYLTRN